MKARKAKHDGKPWPDFGVQLAAKPLLAVDLYIVGYGFQKRIIAESLDEAKQKAAIEVYKPYRKKIRLVPVRRREELPQLGSKPAAQIRIEMKAMKRAQKIRDEMDDREWTKPAASIGTFDPSKVRPHVVLLCEIESKHRSKPISKHKWRPLQSGFSVTEAAKILEHENDNDHETA